MSVVVLTEEEWGTQYDTLVPKWLDLFKDGTDSPEVRSEVLSIVNQHPTSACITALVTALIQSANSAPKSIDNFVQVVSSLQPDFEGIIVDYSGAETSFPDVFHVKFLDYLDTVLSRTQLYEPPRNTVEPSNRTLTCALLSGSCIQHGLIQKQTAPYRWTFKALHLSRSEAGKTHQEVNALGACLQLAVAGKTMMADGLGESYDKEMILHALKEKVVINHPQGQELLQEIILNAENDFVKIYNAEEAWCKLFPEA